MKNGACFCLDSVNPAGAAAEELPGPVVPISHIPPLSQAPLRVLAVNDTTDVFLRRTNRRLRQGDRCVNSSEGGLPFAPGTPLNVWVPCSFASGASTWALNDNQTERDAMLGVDVTIPASGRGAFAATVEAR
jgi:hypothetical protein